MFFVCCFHVILWYFQEKPQGILSTTDALFSSMHHYAHISEDAKKTISFKAFKFAAWRSLLSSVRYSDCSLLNRHQICDVNNKSLLCSLAAYSSNISVRLWAAHTNSRSETEMKSTSCAVYFRSFRVNLMRCSLTSQFRTCVLTINYSWLYI